MIKRKFTTVTQLHEKNNQDIIDYFESARGTYAQAQRKTFYAIRNSPDFNKSSYNTHLQRTYGILKRTANSIIADAQGQLNALKELKAHEQKQLAHKIKVLEANIHALEVGKSALKTGKDICVENLNFKTAKASTLRKQGRKYNETLHSLAYRQFIDKIERRAYRSAISVRHVNPAWTSWLAKQLYCPTMKLNTHVGAAYVIARRGQGYKDSVK